MEALLKVGNTVQQFFQSPIIIIRLLIIYIYIYIYIYIFLNLQPWLSNIFKPSKLVRQYFYSFHPILNLQSILTHDHSTKSNNKSTKISKTNPIEHRGRKPHILEREMIEQKWGKHIDILTIIFRTKIKNKKRQVFFETVLHNKIESNFLKTICQTSRWYVGSITFCFYINISVLKNNLLNS